MDLEWTNGKAIRTTLRVMADGLWRLRAPAGQKVGAVRSDGGKKL